MGVHYIDIICNQISPPVYSLSVVSYLSFSSLQCLSVIQRVARPKASWGPADPQDRVGTKYERDGDNTGDFPMDTMATTPSVDTILRPPSYETSAVVENGSPLPAYENLGYDYRF